jgi:hypothetical protein
MTLKQLIANLKKLELAGAGDLEVFARHGASGAAYEVGTAYVTDEVGELGPFDVDGKYVSLYVGN